MFNDSLFSGKMKRATRLTWLTLPLSMLFHALVIASLVVAPLIRADSNLPQVKVTNVLVMAPDLPQPPSRGTGRKNDGAGKVNGGKKTDGKADRSNQPIPSGKLQAPYKVPETIEEDLMRTGVENDPANNDVGIPEGFDDVGPSTILGVDDGKTVNTPQPALRIANVQMPRKIKEVKPVYAPTAIAARVQGKVIIEAMTDVFGRVRSARIIYSASPLLNDSALYAIKQWLYEPYILNGIPKPVLFTVTINFTLAQ